MKDAYSSVIVVLDLESDKFEILCCNEDFPFDIQWVNSSSIVGTALINPLWRMGYIYCTNRESRIFHTSLDGKKHRTYLFFLSEKSLVFSDQVRKNIINNIFLSGYISEAGRAAFSPRVQPEGKTVVWTERAVDGPHQRAHAIMTSTTMDLDVR